MECSAQSRHFSIVFVLGPPGSGKGTLCKLAIESLKKSSDRYCHLSVGDRLRELCNIELPCECEKFDLDMILDHLRESKLLPADVLIPVLEDEIYSILTGNDGTITWLIDGFPRNMETALAFEEKIGKPAKVIVLECTRENAQQRFLHRSREKNDNGDKFEKRYSEYVENMEAIRKHYGSNIKTICVDGPADEHLVEFITALPSTTTTSKDRKDEEKA
ncbi:P-loop containing nucleoside triphosphate hydrolase protein [Annulohypoxylon truncatum]|uniref:P-loop containing nucleoside triphosphate hydrolase protein n=1 Tax=Annulohypoxylon truncatum TaxID=327061 RepID=UPI002007DB17|nr:P-loop containing nucleoside triphosphate hydrolase protein [Annulohypoxylon truncatum]KAI1208192.1 P-loop containing nucleoside triphosphate hydrolase protein [Annulohypoxylon truncatum]